MKIKNLLRAAAGLGLALGTCAAYADTYALLMGVNDYPEPMGADGKPLTDKDGNVISNDLHGAVNDVNDMHDILRDKFGVSEANIKIATDAAAGEKGFLDNMLWLLKAAKPGDQAIFYYSGHGGQIKVDTKEDPTGKEEVIVLADDKLVPDKLFSDIAKGLAKKGVNITFVLDSCHAGGMSRNPDPGVIVKTKSLDLAKISTAKSIGASELAGLKTTAKGSVTGTGDEKGSYAFLFACQADQTSSDLQFKDPKKPAHGLFTLVLSIMLKDKPEMDLDSMESLAADLIKKNDFKQVPNFEYSSVDRSKKPLVWK